MFKILLWCRQRHRKLTLRRSILSTQLPSLRKTFEMQLIQQTQQNVMRGMFCFLCLLELLHWYS